MNNFKKDLACNITLIFILVATAVHILVITLNLFGATHFVFAYNFSYIVAYIMVILCLLLYCLGFFISSQKRIVFPSWLRILFYFAFFIFTNIYHLFGLYDNYIFNIFFFMYIAFLINIVSVSVFYNVQRDEKYRLKTSKGFITTSVFLYSTGAMLILEFLVTAIRLFIFPTSPMSNLTMTVIELSSCLFVSIVMLILFDLSLSKSKKFINSCLVKYITKSPQRTIKEK